MVQGYQQGSHDAHALSLGGQASQQRNGLQLLVGRSEVVLSLIEEVEAQLSGSAAVLHDFLEALPHVGANGLLSHTGEGNAELHDVTLK